MVPLSLMVRLVEAVRDDAQLVLVGDPDQLAAIEVGAVLRDIVGPAAQTPAVRRRHARGARARSTGEPIAGLARASARSATGSPCCAAATAASRRSARLAEAIRARRRGRDGRCARAPTTAASSGSRDPAAEPAPCASARSSRLRADDRGRASRRREPALLRNSPRFRLLCAHRHGPLGVAPVDRVGRGVARAAQSTASTRAPQRYPGLPLLVTRNDYELRLHNGDTGVVVRGPTPASCWPCSSRRRRRSSSRPHAWPTSSRCSRRPSTRARAPSSRSPRCSCPSRTRPLLSRELLYTGVTRARTTLIVAGSRGGGA